MLKMGDFLAKTTYIIRSRLLRGIFRFVSVKMFQRNGTFIKIPHLSQFTRLPQFFRSGKTWKTRKIKNRENINFVWFHLTNRVTIPNLK